jgi:signal transduction histidine kinase
MASRAHLRALGCVFVLMALSAGAAANSGAPRIVVICGLAALIMMELLRRALRTLETHQRIAVEEILVGIPIDQTILVKSFIAMEAQLEHAPVSALVTPGWQARGGKTTFTVEPSTLEMLIDPGQLAQALINLLQNAAEACAGGRLMLEVHDNGPGVPEELIAHIFTPFFSTKTKGSGIGLAMVRQLIHGNGGTVRYVKSAGGGGRFVVTF